MNDSLDLKIDNFFKPISDEITNLVFSSVNFYGESVPLIVLWLLFASFIFTFYFNFLNIRFFKRAVQVALGKYDNPNHPGEIATATPAIFPKPIVPDIAAVKD